MQNAAHYDFMVSRLRNFFQRKGYIEVPTQMRTSILAACEDPKTITEYTLGNVKYPLPQTGQMWLEYELLKNPDVPGFFCSTASYRDEPNPIEGRHYRLFPMFEFEGKGLFEDLQSLESELLVELGFDAPVSLKYEDMCERYETKVLEAKHETAMCEEISTSISLEHFPTRSQPFWNMQYVGNDTFNKIDIVLHGMETIGSAARSCNPDEMRDFFYSVSDGNYAQLLFDKFTKERVERELNEYLSLDFFPRFGGGIGITRLENAFKQQSLFELDFEYVPSYVHGSATRLST